MKILITGNMGYIGPVVARHLRLSYPNALLVGMDSGFFANCLTTSEALPEIVLDQQYFADVRDVTEVMLKDVDAVVHLAAVSNDPMGNRYEEVTMDINYRASVVLAKRAKEAGVRSFVFASSCSVYGYADNSPRTEQSEVNPLTAYARSKILSEEALFDLASNEFKVTCLRFATACGASPRLRLDLVLNDFVVSALRSKEIKILSDGTPWRPLIDVKDMARAIDWAIGRNVNTSGAFLVINIGSNEWNYQVKDLALAVSRVIPDVKISINADAQPDKRTYKVDFGLFKRLAPAMYLPQSHVLDTIREIEMGIALFDRIDANFRSSDFIRLNLLEKLTVNNMLNHELRWKYRIES